MLKRNQKIIIQLNLKLYFKTKMHTLLLHVISIYSENKTRRQSEETRRALPWIKKFKEAGGDAEEIERDSLWRKTLKQNEATQRKWKRFWKTMKRPAVNNENHIKRKRFIENGTHSEEAWKDSPWSKKV